MIFTILLISALLIIAAMFIGLLYFYDSEAYYTLSALGFIILAVMSVFIITAWDNHAMDLARVSSQQAIIAVQEDRLESLSKRLEGFGYPAGSLFNADSPVASIVQSINDAEESLAKARAERAEAIRSIEARRLGPVSSVIHFVGDYK